MLKYKTDFLYSLFYFCYGISVILYYTILSFLGIFYHTTIILEKEWFLADRLYHCGATQLVNLADYYYTLMMEISDAFETLKCIYQTVWSHIKMNRNFEFIKCSNLLFHSCISWSPVSQSATEDRYAFEKTFTAVAKKPSGSLASFDQAVAPFILGITSLSMRLRTDQLPVPPSHLPINLYIFILISYTFRIHYITWSLRSAYNSR